MRWLRKWTYLIVFLATGAGYFAWGDHWQVYAEPMNRFLDWYEELKGEDSSVLSQGVVPLPGAGEGAGAGPENGGGSGETGTDSGAENEGKDTVSVPGDGSGSGEPGTDSETGNGSSGGTGSGAGGGETGFGAGSEGAGNRPETGEGAETGSENGGGIGSGTDGSGTGEGAGANGGTAGEQTGTVAYSTVEDDYFSDALFIGDSRTVGMFEYGGLEETATFYASKGLTVYKLFDSQIVPAPGGKITVEEGLQQNTFAKIYLMVGINEMGTGTVETFLEKYKEVVEHLRELQPDAIIYIQGIIKVTAERSAKGDYINNEGIEARNEGIAPLADNEKVFYLDVNPLICDESGGMTPSYTFDGVHLLGKYIEIWKDYLKTHAISP